MKNAKNIFVVLFLCTILPANGDSLLQATAFPKTFDDLDFVDKYAVLAESYGAFDKVYDENGKCISGCPYAGMTIEQDKQNTEEATQYFADLVAAAEPEIGTTSVQPDAPITTPDTPIIPDKPSVPTQSTTSTQPTQMVSRDSLPLRSPVNTGIALSGDFGWRNIENKHYLHNGIDIAIATGTPVYAVADGVVKTITTGCTDGNKRCGGGNGNYVLVSHAYGLFTEYKHLSSVSVSKNTSVHAGQLIGYSGNTGYSFGPHLHYDIYLSKNGTPAYIDVLCPCAGSHKTSNYNESLNTINTGYSCAHSALNTPYRFQGNEKKTAWRIASGHCMKNAGDKLPDEK